MSGFKNLAAPRYKLLLLSLTLTNCSVNWVYYLTALGFQFPHRLNGQHYLT